MTAPSVQLGVLPGSGEVVGHRRRRDAGAEPTR